MFFLKGHQSVTKKQGFLIFAALLVGMGVMLSVAPIAHAKNLKLAERVKAASLYANLLSRGEHSGDGSDWTCIKDMEGYRYKNGGGSDTNWPPSNGDNAANQNTFVGSKTNDGIKKWKGVDPITATVDGSCAGLMSGFINIVEDGSPAYTSFYKRMGGKFFTSTETSETCAQGVCQSGEKKERSAWVFRDWSECKQYPHATWDRFNSNVNNLNGITSPNVPRYSLPDSRSSQVPPTSCAPTKGDKAIQARFKDAAKSAFGDTPFIGSGSPEQWFLYYSTFISKGGCAASADTSLSEMPAENPDSSGAFYYKIPVATKNGKGDVIHKYSNGVQTFWMTASGAGGFLAKRTCGDIGTWLQNNTDAFTKFQEYATAHPDEYKDLGIGSTVDETVQGTTDTTKDAAGEEGEEESDCSTHLSGVGWFVCPVLNVATSFADGAWGMLEGLLVLNVLPHADDPNSVYGTWQNLRDIANVLLVIIFITVIISQISNVGLSNYNIKRILPRFIVAAIMINISYFAMQLIVDVSNVIGATLLGLITESVEDINLSDVGWSSVLADLAATGTLTAGAVAGVTIAAATISAGSMFIFLGLTIIPAILGIVAGVFALIFRAALVPILAIVAPIAFVAWILPNTQSLFDRWRKLFSGLVFLYPIAALYYGALKFAALSTLNNEDSNLIQRFAALGLLFIGSFVIFGIALKSNSIMNMMMGKMTGAFNKAAKPLSDKAAGYAGARRDARKAEFMARDHSKGRGLRSFVGRRMQAFDKRSRDLKTRGGLSAQNLEQEYQAGLAAASPEELKNRLGFAAGTPGGQAYIEKLSKEAAARRLKFEFKGSADKALEQSNDKYLQAAAAEELAGSGAWGASVLRSYMERGGAVTSVDMAQAMTNVKKYDAGVAAAGVQAMNDFYDGSSSVDFSRDKFADITANAVGKLSKETTATQSAAALSTAIAKETLSRDKVKDIVKESRLSSVASDDALQLLKDYNSNPGSTTVQAGFTLDKQLSQPQPLKQKPSIPPLGNSSAGGSSTPAPAQPQPQASSGTPSQAPTIQPQPRQAANSQPQQTPPPVQVQNEAAQPEPRKNPSLFNNRSRNNNRPFN